MIGLAHRGTAFSALRYKLAANRSRESPQRAPFASAYSASINGAFRVENTAKDANVDSRAIV